MGLLTDIIIADPSEAEAICASDDHLKQWPCIGGKGLDNMKFAALWSVLNPQQSSADLEGDKYLVFMAARNGPWVFCLPDDLRDRLARLQATDIHQVASRWIEDEELQLDGWQLEDAEMVLEALSKHAAQASAAAKPLLLWMCL